MPATEFGRHDEGGSHIGRSYLGCAPDIELVLKEYYPIRGLAPDGRPARDMLERLGLSDLGARLYG